MFFPNFFHLLIFYFIITNLSPNAGIGCDAKVALDIHNLREENPGKFYNQVMKIVDLTDNFDSSKTIHYIRSC